MFDPTATRKFMSSVFRGMEGWTTISFWADTTNNNWTPHKHNERDGVELRGNQWFYLPTDFGKMMAFIKANRRKDLYFTPYVFASRESRAKWNATHTRAVTIDADDCHPDNFLKVPTWSWETSPGSYQAIWILKDPVGAEDAQGVARSISTHHTSDGADGSGWDVGQLLRIPHGSTHNKDPRAPHIVGNLKKGPYVYSIASLSRKYPPMEVAKIIRAEDVDVEPIKRIPMDIQHEIEQTDTAGKDRSTARTRFIYKCVERGYTDGQCLYLLSQHKICQELEAEKSRNWTQFYLGEVSKARLKHPHVGKKCKAAGCDGKGSIHTEPDNVIPLRPDQKTHVPAVSIPVAASKEDLQAVLDQGDDYWAEQRKKLDMSVDFRHVHFAEFVADQCNENLRYVEGIGWFAWNGKVWELAESDRLVMNSITQASQRLALFVSGDPSNREWAMKACSRMLVHGARNGIVNEMKNLDQLSAPVADLDTKRDLLSFQNGTVELRTGKLREHERSDYLTQCAPIEYDPNAKCPRWLRFIEEVFPGDPDLQRYVQTFLGYCITGETREQVLGVWHGDRGRNGKGTILRLMTHIFGSQLIKRVKAEMFYNIRGQQPHTEDIAAMRGARMVWADEFASDVRVNVGLLKDLSGESPVSTRHLYGKTFEYTPTFTTVLIGNDLPDFPTGDTALWARTKAVPFTQSFTGREDKSLEEVLRSEASGIAAWIIEGASRYYAEGLQDVDAVTAHTEDFRDETGCLGALQGDLFEYDEKNRILQSTFHQALKTWQRKNGITRGSDDFEKFMQKNVKKALLTSGKVAEGRTNAGRAYTGIRLAGEFALAPKRK